VRFLRTTISCVAVAFLCALPAAGLHAAGLIFPLLPKWSITLQVPPAFPPAYDAARAFVALQNNQLMSVSLETGKSEWSLESSTTAAPAAGDSLVFTGGAGYLQASAQQDGAQRWRTPVDGSVTSLYWDTGWLLATTDKSALFAIRATDGAVIWRRDLEATLHSVPAPDGDRLYLLLNNGTLLALAMETGDPVWTKALPKPGSGVLAVGNRLYVGAQDDIFYCLSAKDGKVVWRWKAGGDVIGTAAIDAKHVYFLAMDNVLRALDRNSGSMRWQKPLSMRPSTGPLLTGWSVLVAGSPAQLQGYSSEFNGTPLGDPLVLKSADNQELQLASPPYLMTDATLVLITKGGLMQALIGSPAPYGP
jgi:outer membrane protein assembly factor BamB